MSNKVLVEVKTYEDPSGSFDSPPVRVHSHWNFDDRIVLELGNGKVTVIASDMQAAIKAATTKRVTFG